jgi:hypothetical protein
MCTVHRSRMSAGSIVSVREDQPQYTSESIPIPIPTPTPMGTRSRRIANSWLQATAKPRLGQTMKKFSNPRHRHWCRYPKARRFSTKREVNHDRQGSRLPWAQIEISWEASCCCATLATSCQCHPPFDYDNAYGYEYGDAWTRVAPARGGSKLTIFLKANKNDPQLGFKIRGHEMV